MPKYPDNRSKKAKQHECFDLLVECGLDPEIATFYLGLAMINNRDPMHFIFEAMGAFKMYMDQEPDDQEEQDQITFTFDEKTYH
jgi:hypothetical protein